MTPHQRLCFQCLHPEGNQSKGKHSNGTCQNTFTCKHTSHDKYPCKKHVLVCGEQYDTKENMTIFEDYKNRFIMKQDKPLPHFCEEMKLAFLSIPSSTTKYKSSNAKTDEATDNAIYTLQTIEVDGQQYTLFFDSGCLDLVSKYDAIRRMKGHAQQLRDHLQ